MMRLRWNWRRHDRPPPFRSPSFEEAESIKRICGGVGDLRIRILGKAGENILMIERFEGIRRSAAGVDLNCQLHGAEASRNRRLTQGLPSGYAEVRRH
jgi:hypothetical protein